MIIEVPDSIVEDLRIVDAVFSGRATKGVRSTEEIEKTLADAYRILSGAQDKLSSMIVRRIEKERGS